MVGADEVPLFALGQLDRVLVGRLEIVPGLDEPRPEPCHRAVLLDAVAVWHDDRRIEPQPRRGERDALPVIARGRGHDAANIGLRPPDLVEIDETAADLEGADRRMVLVLDPQLGAEAARQQRPAILRGRRHHPMHERRRFLQCVEVDDHGGGIPLIFARRVKAGKDGEARPATTHSPGYGGSVGCAVSVCPATPSL